MDLEQKFIKDHFFIISSENLKDVKPAFYGYVILDDTLNVNNYENKPIPDMTAGTYINIVCRRGEIIIQQDFWGGYGLYYYKKDDKFYISNSLFYMAYILQKKENLTLNDNYIALYMLSELAPIAAEETILDGIYQVPVNVTTVINTRTGTLKFIKTERNLRSIAVDTTAGMKIIDKWRDKYNNLYKTLVADKDNIKIDLTGGFDSRLTLAAIMPVQCLENVYIFSNPDNKQNHAEDLRIASEICKIYSLPVNKFIKADHFSLSNENGLLISMLVKGGFHSQFYAMPKYRKKPLYAFNGHGGGVLRNFWNYPVQEWVESRFLTDDFANCGLGLLAKKSLDKSIGYILSNFKENLNENAKFYFYTRMRFHFSKAHIENLMTNVVPICPLMDPMLHMLNQKTSGNDDLNLLNAIVYTRYIPEVARLPFDKGRAIAKETFEKAEKINAEFPVRPSQPAKFNINYVEKNSYKFLPEAEKTTIYDHIANIATGSGCRDFFRTKYNAKLYNNAIKFHDYKDPASGKNYINRLVSIYEFSQFTNKHSDNPYIDHTAWLINDRPKKSFGAIHNMLCISRVDISNEGAPTNSVEVQCVDKFEVGNNYIKIMYPHWLKTPAGQGATIESDMSRIRLELLAHGAGKIVICIRGLAQKTPDGKWMPLRITYHNITFKNLTHPEYTPNPRLPAELHRTFASPFNVAIQCDDNDKIIFNYSARPYNYSFKALQQIYYDLYELNNLPL